MPEHRGGALAAEWVCVLIWGATFVSSKTLLADMGPVSILLCRTVLATAVLFVLCRGRMPKVSLRTEALFALAGLSGVCLYFVLENIALLYTTASNVSVIVSVSPLLTGFVSLWILRTPPLRWNFYVGFAAAIAGIWLVSGGGTGVGNGAAGDLLSLASAFCWAVYSVVIRRLGREGLPVRLVTRRVFVYGLAFLVIAFMLSGETIDPAVFMSVPDILNLLFLGLGASAFCFFAWNYAVDVLGPVRTTACLYAVPVVTVLLAAVLLNERVSPEAMAGIALTLGGMVIAQHSTSQ